MCIIMCITKDNNLHQFFKDGVLETFATKDEAWDVIMDMEQDENLMQNVKFMWVKEVRHADTGQSDNTVVNHP